MSTENLTPDARTPTRQGPHAGDMLRYLTVAGLVFLSLVMALEPEVGFTAPPAARLLFWAAQIFAGLLVLQSMLYLLTRLLGASRVPSWALVALSGIAGAVVLAPVYWLIGEGMMERWFGYPATPDEHGVDLDGSSVGQVLLEEYIDIVGPVTTAWVLICLSRLHWLVPPLLRGQGRDAVHTPDAAAASAQAEPGSDATAVDDDPPAITARRARARPAQSIRAAGRSVPDTTAAMRSAAPPEPHWHARLPAEIGNDVMAVVSELQYLRVWTPRGCALILGSLAEVEAEGRGIGVRVHRSWWVACRHVTSVRRTATGAVCTMSDGREVPVSRRRRAEILARFGDGARYVVPNSSEAVSQADLD